MSSLVPPRKPAPRLARPAQRYWKGKAPKGADAAASDSDEEDEGEQQQEMEEDEEQVEDMPLEVVSKGKGKAMKVGLKDVNIHAGKVIVGGREESGRTAMEESEDETESSEEEDEPAKKEESGSSEEETSSGEEEESEEEQKPKLQFRPVFVPKRSRVTIQEREADDPYNEEVQAKKEAEAEQRKKDSHNLVAESIKRELAEKEVEEVIPDVDDRDGEDPEAEFEAWRLRELGRIKRDKEKQLEREREKEEIERRRAMPEAERMKEDLERAQKLRDEKPKGQQKFLQKYWHKGAFHQDADILKKHDFTEATESTVDVSSLPKVMQVKNFGKRSQTKYTHLLDQDTTRKDQQGKGGNAVCFLCGGPHLKRDCPSNPQNNGEGLTGANAVSGASAGKKWGVGSRQAADERERDRRDRSWRDRDDGDRRPPPPPPRSDYQRDASPRRERGPRDDDRAARRYDRRSRSRSPPRRDDRDDRRRRSRSRSMERERDRYNDKRRRVY